MNQNENRDELLFKQALLKPSPADRAAYLDEACQGEPALRARLELLLEGHFKGQGFLDTLPQAGSHTRLIRPAGELTEKPGDRIGRYKLLQKIGEGGCGVVYMAEQEEPVRRRVALKVIKLGMDTEAVIARFEAERQALALMDHPNIAKVFDAGATESPSPHPQPLSHRMGEGSRKPGEGGTFPPPSDGRGIKGEGYLPAGRPYFVMELIR